MKKFKREIRIVKRLRKKLRKEYYSFDSKYYHNQRLENAVDSTSIVILELEKLLN